MTLYKRKARTGFMFRRFLAYCLALLVLPIVLFSFIIMTTTQKIEADAIKQNFSVLEQVRNEIDSQMQAIYACVIGINYNTTINRVLERDIASADVADMMLSFKDLSAFEQGSDRLYLYSDNMNSLLSSKGCYSTIDKIYGTVLQYGAMDYHQFHTSFLEPRFHNRYVPVSDVIVDSQATRAILYIQSVPLGPAGRQLGNILYFIEEASVLKTLDSLQLSDGGWACIVSDDREVITGLGNYPRQLDSVIRMAESSDGQNAVYLDDMILTSTRSDVNGWRFIAAIPKRYILQEANSIRVTVAVLFGIYVVLGVCFSLFVSFKSFKPLQEVAELIYENTGDRGKRVNEYQLLREYVENLTQNNRSLTTSLDSYVKSMESSQISNLICGRYNTAAELEELEELSSCANIVKQRWFTVVLVDFLPGQATIDRVVLDELMVRRLMVKELITDLETDGMVLGEIDVNKLGLLFYSQEKQGVGEQVEQIRALLAENLKGRVCIGVGSCCEGALQISFSNLQADCALRAALKEPTGIMNYSNIPRAAQGLYFPEHLRTTLMQAIANGNIKQVKSTLKILDIENFTTREIDPEDSERLISEMHLLVAHLQEEGIAGSAPELESSLAPHDRFYRYSNLLMRICSNSTDLSDNLKKRVNEDILRFVDDNYADSNLCLSMLADRFNLSEAYLSYLFKKTLNINFSSYLEEKRIEQAKLMLISGKFSIETVAETVGYNSPHAFRRVFKKVAGINPRDIKTAHPL